MIVKIAHFFLEISLLMTLFDAKRQADQPTMHYKRVDYS